MTTHPSDKADGPLGLDIRTQGEALSDAVNVISVNTEARADGHSEAWVRIEAGSLAIGAFPHTDGRVFTPGKEISIGIFYGDATAQAIFAGEITGLRFLIAEGQPVLEVQCAGRTAQPELKLSEPELSISAGRDLIDCDLTLMGADSEVFAKVTGRVTFLGSALVKPGVTLKLDGLGDRFGGAAVAIGVRHAISAGDWATDVLFGDAAGAE